MPYPYTIQAGWSPIYYGNGYSGPYAHDGNRYVVMQDLADTKRVSVFKSEDEGENWFETDHTDGPVLELADDQTQALGAFRSNFNPNHLWVVVPKIGPLSLPDVYIEAHCFDLETDTWVAANKCGGPETVPADDAGYPYFFGGSVLDDAVVRLVMGQPTMYGTQLLNLYSAEPGDAWTHTEFPGMDPLASNIGCAKHFGLSAVVLGNEMHFGGRVVATWDVDESCFAGPFALIDDNRAWIVSPADISGALDGCIKRTEEGTEGVDYENHVHCCLTVLNGEIWAVYLTVTDYGTPVIGFTVKGPDTVKPTWAGGLGNEFFAAADPYHAMVASIGNDLVMFYGEYSGEWRIAVYNTDTGWGAPVSASTQYPGLVDGAFVSIAAVSEDDMGVIQNDQYWEAKIADPPGIVDVDPIVEAEQVPAAKIVSERRSLWYRY